MMMVLILGLGLENYCPKCTIHCPALWTKVLQNVLQISIIHHITTLFIKNLGSHMTIIQGMLYNIVSMSFPNHFLHSELESNLPKNFISKCWKIRGITYSKYTRIQNVQINSGILTSLFPFHISEVISIFTIKGIFYLCNSKGIRYF